MKTEPMSYSLKNIPGNVVSDYATTITILDHLSEAIFFVDKYGIVQYANKRSFELLKTDIQGIRGRMIDELFPNKRSDFNGSDSLIDHFKKGHYSELNSYMVFQNISIPVHASFSVVKTASGDLDFIIVSAKDMTIQKSIEKELRNQQIMSISRDRIRALGELSVSLVHELSQPLSTLEMRLELLHKELQGDKNNSKLIKHFSELDDLISRINKSVQVVRIFAYQTEDNSIGLVNIVQAIRNAQRLVMYEMKKRNILFNVDLGDELPFIVGNSLLIEQIFVNLFINARDAFDSQSEVVEPAITIKSEIVDNKWIEIHISDNGPGVDITVSDSIFEPFFSTKKTDKNPGLGLTISKEIVNSMGGNIFLSDKMQAGASFDVRFPLTQDNEREQLANLIEMLHTE